MHFFSHDNSAFALNEPPIAVSILIDTSNSTRDGALELSIPAAKVLIDKLKDGDHVNVIGFNDSPFEVIKLQPKSSLTDDLINLRLKRLFANGRSDAFSSLEMALNNLATVGGVQRHLVVLTDDVGIFSGNPLEYKRIARLVKENAVNMSTFIICEGEEYKAMKALLDAVPIPGVHLIAASEAKNLGKNLIRAVNLKTDQSAHP